VLVQGHLLALVHLGLCFRAGIIRGGVLRSLRAGSWRGVREGSERERWSSSSHSERGWRRGACMVVHILEHHRAAVSNGLQNLD